MRNDAVRTAFSHYVLWASHYERTRFDDPALAATMFASRDALSHGEIQAYGQLIVRRANLWAELRAHLKSPIKGRCFTKALRAWEAKASALTTQIKNVSLAAA